MAIIISTLIVALIIDIVMANLMQKVAFAKGYDTSIHSFAICLLIGFMGYIYVIALPDLIARKNQEDILEAVKNQKNSMDENLLIVRTADDELPPL
ncbi:hypothetical protein LQE92_05000 [Lacrimispora sp. NSJ-141]|uniref:Uncharacterized protein n=1 Tax=Lientehia hominis TaxID=2897778 RepID=A0AAP2W9I9_9FIRM|nr:hypothetical protein [Lientehia hominis]MCD2491982.1 hypothetical protein [Lientehia hominis]